MTRTIALAATLALLAGGALAQSNHPTNTAPASGTGAAGTPNAASNSSLGITQATSDRNVSIGTTAPRNSPMNPSYNTPGKGALFSLNDSSVRSSDTVVPPPTRGGVGGRATMPDAPGARDVGVNDSATGGDIDSLSTNSEARSRGYDADPAASAEAEARSQLDRARTANEDRAGNPNWLKEQGAAAPAPAPAPGTSTVTGSDTLGVGKTATPGGG